MHNIPLGWDGPISPALTIWLSNLVSFPLPFTPMLLTQWITISIEYLLVRFITFWLLTTCYRAANVRFIWVSMIQIKQHVDMTFQVSHNVNEFCLYMLIYLASYYLLKCLYQGIGYYSYFPFVFCLLLINILSNLSMHWRNGGNGSPFTFSLCISTKPMDLQIIAMTWS